MVEPTVQIPLSQGTAGSTTDGGAGCVGISVGSMSRHFPMALGPRGIAVNTVAPFQVTDEHIRKIWTSEPDRFIIDSIHKMQGLNTYISLPQQFVQSLFLLHIVLLNF